VDELSAGRADIILEELPEPLLDEPWKSLQNSGELAEPWKNIHIRE
jgi:hypothetical protein